jgi:hypothetical protein
MWLPGEAPGQTTHTPTPPAATHCNMLHTQHTPSRRPAGQAGATTARLPTPPAHTAHLRAEQHRRGKAPKVAPAGGGAAVLQQADAHQRRRHRPPGGALEFCGAKQACHEGHDHHGEAGEEGAAGGVGGQHADALGEVACRQADDGSGKPVAIVSDAGALRAAWAFEQGGCWPARMPSTAALGTAAAAHLLPPRRQSPRPRALPARPAWPFA